MGAAARRPRQVVPPHHRVLREAAARECGPVVGVLGGGDGADAAVRDRVRPLDVAPRLPGVLPPQGRQLDEDRLLEEGGGVDEAAGEGRGDGAGGDPRKLVYR